MSFPTRVRVGGDGWIKVEIVNASLQPIPGALLRAGTFLLQPFRDAKVRKDALLQVRQRGPDSVGKQFAGGYFASPTGAARAWPRSKPFGTRPAPARTLNRSGKLRLSWTTDGSGSFTRAAGDLLAFGSTLPYAAVHQSRTPTIVRPKRKARDGRWAQFWKLALTFGVWLSEEKLRRGLVIPSRRVGVGRKSLALVGKQIAARAVQYLEGGAS